MNRLTKTSLTLSLLAALAVLAVAVIGNSGLEKGLESDTEKSVVAGIEREGDIPLPRQA